MDCARSLIAPHRSSSQVVRGTRRSIEHDTTTSTDGSTSWIRVPISDVHDGDDAVYGAANRASATYASRDTPTTRTVPSPRTEPVAESMRKTPRCTHSVE